MENPFEEITQKLDTLIKDVAELKKNGPCQPSRITFTEFCKSQNITRPTGYAWADRGLIKMEKIGGRNFVISDSILVKSKYQRQPQQA
ncbi:hypothetical protein KK083_15220 [Fulvivirgaceae bacterium PWU4]|uniref:Uncharacterized protein n=1 Tax=Chryseosolibacter histidini TaxID=2782349 RepID=A0AAP2GQ85_9BACT|nr:hypothetical protein [Chryseosolibacter histidini]MBT1698242.1 hypothetical protein [Chryseosolibacter histidini]